MKLNVLSFPSNKFVWMGSKGVGEVSELGNRHLQRLYDDACDLGFVVDGKYRSLTFVMTAVVQDGEGDITGWDYSAIEMPHITITIYND